MQHDWALCFGRNCHCLNLSSYQNKTHFPDTQRINIQSAEWSLSIYCPSHIPGAAGNITAHLPLITESFHPTVLSQNNQLKVYLRRELSIFYLCHANREGGERSRAVKTWEYGDNLPASLLPHAEAVACCSSNDRRLSPASFSLQSSISSLHYQSCHNWAMAS